MIRIFVKAFVPIFFQIEPSDTVEDVEAKIEAEGMGPVMNDNWKSKLKPDKPIVVESRVFKDMELEVDISDTIERFKTKLQDLINTPPDQQILLFAGKGLQDHQTLADYNIGRDSTLHLIPRVSLVAF